MHGDSTAEVRAQRNDNASVWASFAAPRNSEEFYASWLAILCAQVGKVDAAMLLLGPDPQGGYTPAAIWPDARHDVTRLGAIARRALAERRGVLEQNQAAAPAPEAHAQVAYPVEFSGTLYGLAVLELAARSEQDLQHALRLMHWAMPALVGVFRDLDVAEQKERLRRVSAATDIVGSAMQEAKLAASALAVVNEIVVRLDCSRVSLGLEDHQGDITVIAISHSATFERRANTVRLLREAMEEVLDQGGEVVYPSSDEQALAMLAHAGLAQEARDLAVLSVPLPGQGRDIGVLTLERASGGPFDQAAIELCRVVGLLVGPILELKRANERGIVRRAWEAGRDAAQTLFGPRRAGAKMLALIAAAIILFLAFANGEYRVAARTAVEGAIQRASVASFDGYVAESLVRAGDVVKAGQTLARLDDRDLRLERVKAASEREQHRRRYQQALASYDRAEMNVLAAQISQVEAQIALIDEKLARAQLVAPFDGVVVSGDLSKLIGTPVEQGKVLFEIAPLDAYRVILKVDERDIGYVAAGQQGQLALSGIPGVLLPFSVKQITPVSVAEEGRNFFRVEARMETALERLRPGMEGIGKISAGERRLLWIWTHPLTDWIRLSLWNWMP